MWVIRTHCTTWRNQTKVLTVCSSISGKHELNIWYSYNNQPSTFQVWWLQDCFSHTWPFGQTPALQDAYHEAGVPRQAALWHLRWAWAIGCQYEWYWHYWLWELSRKLTGMRIQFYKRQFKIGYEYWFEMLNLFCDTSTLLLICELLIYAHSSGMVKDICLMFNQTESSPSLNKIHFESHKLIEMNVESSFSRNKICILSLHPTAVMGWRIFCCECGF